VYSPFFLLTSVTIINGVHNQNLTAEIDEEDHSLVVISHYTESDSRDEQYREVLEEGLRVTEVPDDLQAALATSVIYWMIGVYPPPSGGDATSPRSILLIGDSHMAVWMYAFDEIGKKYNYHIHLSWWNSCPTFKYRPDLWDPRCVATIDNYVSITEQLKPDYVFMEHMYWVGYEPKGDEIEALEQQVTALNNLSKLVMMSDNPFCDINADNCLAASKNNLQDCGCRREESLHDDWRETEASVAKKLGVPFVDTTDLFCLEDRCPPIVNRNIRVMIDGNHPTPQFLIFAIPKFERLLVHHGIHFTPLPSDNNDSSTDIEEQQTQE